MEINKIRDEGYFVHVTPNEALALIKSLSSQLHAESGNSGRLESRTDKGKYFSVAVDFTKENFRKPVPYNPYEEPVKPKRNRASKKQNIPAIMMGVDRALGIAPNLKFKAGVLVRQFPSQGKK